MTNEEAARNLILMFSRYEKGVQPSERNLELANEAVQIAIYALSSATANGIQFGKSLKTDYVADGEPCTHDDLTEYKHPTAGEIITKCNICGQVLSREKM